MQLRFAKDGDNLFPLAANMYFNLDLENRFNPIFEKAREFSEIFKSDRLARITNMVLSLATFFQPEPVRVALTLQVGSGIGWNLTQKIIKDYKASAYVETSRDLLRLTANVALVAFTIFRPSVAAILGESFKIVSNVNELCQAIKAKEGINAASKFLLISFSAIHIMALTTKNPITIATSIVAQGLFEFYSAYNEYKNDRWLEGGCRLVVAAIRLVQFKKYMQQHSNQIRLTYKKATEKIVYNEPSDLNMIVIPKQNFKTQTEDFTSYRHQFDFWGGEEEKFVSGKSSVLKVATKDDKGLFFYTYLRLPPTSRSIIDRPPLAEQYLDSIKEKTGIQFDPVSHTCSHPALGKGQWVLNDEFRNAHQASDWRERAHHHSLSLSIYFGNDNSEQWFNTTKTMQIKKA